MSNGDGKDWFADNAPKAAKQSGDDWFATNAPSGSSPDIIEQARAVVRRPIERATDSTFVPTHGYGGGGMTVSGKPEQVQQVKDAKRTMAETGVASAATAGLGNVPGVLGFLLRGLAAGGGAATAHAGTKVAETGSPDLSGAAKTGAGFAAAEMGGEGLAKSASAIVGKLRPKIDPTIKINDLLGVTPNEVMVGSTPQSLSDFAQNPARGVLKSGLDEKMLAKMNPLERNVAIYKAKNTVGQQLDAVFTKASGTPNGGANMLPQTAGGAGKAAKKVDFQKVMDGVFAEGVIPDKALAKQTAKRLQQIIDKAGLNGKLLSELTPKEAWELRKGLDDFSKFSSEKTAKTFGEVAYQLRSGLRDALHKVVPESTALDQQYTDLVGASTAVQRQAEKYAITTPESKLRAFIMKAMVKAGTRALPLP